MFLKQYREFNNRYRRRIMQKVSIPEEEGVSSRALIRLLEKLEFHNIPMHSLLIARHGSLVLEAYYKPYERNTLHRMFSETKSFTSLAIGLLEADGKISLNDRICSFFPEYLPGRVHPWMEQMTVENLLEMETCHDKTTYIKDSTTENWVRSFFQSVPTHRPGSIFQYDTSASHTLCALVEKLTGQKMLDFLKDRVLRKIGFSEESYVIEDPFGVSIGGSGLMARPIDMMRTGLMLLNGGKHPDDFREKNAEQIYPEGYLRRALSFKTPTIMGSSSTYTNGYGYQYWMLPYGGYGMRGMGEQDVFIFPKQDLVIVTTADTQGIPNGGDIIMNDLFTEVFETLSEQSLPGDRKSTEKLRIMTENRKLPSLKSTVKETVQDEINGHRFLLRPNPDGFVSMTLSFRNGRGTLEYVNERGMHEIPFGVEHGIQGVFPEYNQKCCTSGAWYNKNVFSICCWLTDESVASVRFRFAFEKDGELTVLMKKTEETKFNEFEGLLTT
jgi:CubicO group peptidase (beta-lactamase class C family)